MWSYIAQAAQASPTTSTSIAHLREEGIAKYVRRAWKHSHLLLSSRAELMVHFQSDVACVDPEVQTLMQDLAKQFDTAMFEIYRRAKREANYNATIFLRMLSDKGGLATARQLLNSIKVSDGYTHLYERGRLDLTVEAMIVGNKRWHVLFTEEELAAAAKRLKAYGYDGGTL